MTTGTVAGRATGSGAATDAREGGRVIWVDHAKGICIVAVVMMYATHHVHQILRSEGWMEHVVRFAQPFRMPDFFMISGLFVARVIDRPLRRYLDGKVLYFAYFYAVWASFRFSYTDLRHAYQEGSVLRDYLQLFVAPPSGPLWFIYVLALFFIAVRLTRRWHPAVVLALGAGLHLADMHTGLTLVNKFSQYFVFFYCGYLLADRVFGFARWAEDHRRAAALLLMGWAVVNGWAVYVGVSQLPGVSLSLGFVGAMAVVLAAVSCARLPWMNWLSWLGGHSIVIYLGFVIPLGVMRMFVHRAAGTLDAGTVALVVTAGSLTGAALLYQLVRHTPLRFLYVRPGWARLAPEERGRAYV